MTQIQILELNANLNYIKILVFFLHSHAVASRAETRALIWGGYIYIFMHARLRFRKFQWHRKNDNKWWAIFLYLRLHGFETSYFTII